MKHLIILLSLSTLMLSCQKEVTQEQRIVPTNANELIVGTWRVDAIQLWEGNDIKEIHTPDQTIEFTPDGYLFVTGKGVGGTTLTDTIKYTYVADGNKYFLRIEEENRTFQGCLVYLRQEDGNWILGFSRPTGSNTNILWNYHCSKK
jgi:hypothetical protein